jgi:hypothetical protein
MPPTTGAPITPTLGRMPKLGPSGMDRRGQALLTFIILTFTVSAVFVAFDKASQGSATVLVRSVEGARSVENVSLTTGERMIQTGVDVDAITTLSARLFYMDDGTVVTIDSAGIVRKNMADAESATVLVASAVPVSARTPLSVWGDAERIAWVSPADGSIQVFERNSQGAYLPIYLNTGMQVSSLQFTEDGASLVVSKIEDEQSLIASISLATGDVEPVATIPGFVTVLPLR